MQVADLEVIVEPKVGISRLLFLLGYAKDPGFRASDVHGIDALGLFPAVAEALCRQTERALGAGVLQGYLTRDDALMVVRGRARLRDQFSRRPGILLPLEVTYDEYTVDIVENRLLRSAVRRMLTIRRLPAGTRARLGHLDGLLDGVGILTPGVPLPTWQKNRLNHRYQPALRLAEIVLRQQSFETGPGDIPVASFVVDMAKVFEDFVSTGLTEAFSSYPGHTQTQYTTMLDTANAISIRPDIVHTIRGTPRIIANAKYKLQTSGNSYPNADYYQMLAYCTALKVPTGWLVYAQGPTGTATTHRIRNCPTTIVSRPLDLSDTPDGLINQLESLAQQAWHKIASPS